MSVRKKWCTQLDRSRRRSHRSQVATYRYIDGLRMDCQLGMSTVTTVAVFVDEGDGWALYERLTMPTAQDALTRSGAA